MRGPHPTYILSIHDFNVSDFTREVLKLSETFGWPDMASFSPKSSIGSPVPGLKGPPYCEVADLSPKNMFGNNNARDDRDGLLGGSKYWKLQGLAANFSGPNL